MEPLIQRCAGIDVGQAESVVCVRVPDAVTGAPAELIASYGTTTPNLLELLDWLRSLGVSDVAMEPAGVYCKPIYYLLEDDFTVLLVNATHIKDVPGRRTDTIDAAWIAQLLAHGLLTASFVPPPPVRELRVLTRYRKALINEKTAQVNRIHKVLQDSGHQAGDLRHRCDGRLRSGHDGRTGRRPERQRSAGRFGQGPDADQDPGPVQRP
jgi:transposase